jgi:hypothetical protein
VRVLTRGSVASTPGSVISTLNLESRCVRVRVGVVCRILCAVNSSKTT